MKPVIWALAASALLMAGCGITVAKPLNDAQSAAPAATVHLREADNLAHGNLIWESDGFPATVDGWILEAQTPSYGQPATARLINPAGKQVLTNLPASALLAPSGSAPAAVWTTPQGGLTWWLNGKLHHLSRPREGSPWDWTVSLAPNAPIAAIEAYNQDSGTADWAAGISGYQGPIEILNLATGHMMGQISLKQQHDVPSPLIVSSNGARVLLNNLTLWSDQGSLLTTFRAPQPPTPELLPNTYGSISPYFLAANGNVLVAPVVPYRSWNFYDASEQGHTQMNIANWFNPYGKSSASLVVVPWSNQQIVYGPTAVLVQEGRRVHSVPISLKQYRTIESATITSSGRILILALSHTGRHLDLLNGEGHPLISLPWKWGINGTDAQLSANGHSILIQVPGRLMVYQIITS